MLKRLCVSAAPWQNPFTEVKSDLVTGKAKRDMNFDCAT